MDKVLFTKDNIDNLLFQLAKEYKKHNRKNIPAENLRNEIKKFL